MIPSSFYIHHHQDDDLGNDTFFAPEAEDIESLHTTSEFNSITGEDLNYMLSKLNDKNYMFDPAPLSSLKPCLLNLLFQINSNMQQLGLHQLLRILI